MEAATFEKVLKDLGLAYLLGLFLQFRIADRNVLLPFFAIACVQQLEKLVPYAAFSRSRSFTLARWSAYLVVVLGFGSWIPSDLGITLGVLVWVVVLAGSAGYAGALRDWSLLQGWSEVSTRASATIRWMVASGLLCLGALLVHLVVAEPGTSAPGVRYSPASAFGRPFSGWGPAVAILVIFVVWIAAMVRLRGVSHLVRHSLRSQPGARLVEV